MQIFCTVACKSVRLCIAFCDCHPAYVIPTPSVRRRVPARAVTRPGFEGSAATGLYVLVVLTFGAYLPSSLYPGYQRSFHIDDLTMTLIYAVFALASVPALLLLSPAADAVGPRPVLLAGVAAAAVGSGCFALAPDVKWLIAGRAAQGLALGTATAAATVLVGGGNRPDPKRGAVMAGVGFAAGTASGAVVGGVLAQYAPAPTLLPFLLHLLLLGVGWYRVLGLAPAAAASPRRRQWRPTVPRIPRGMRALFATASMVGFLAWTAAGLFLAIIPILLGRSGQRDMAVTGGILGAVLVFSALTQPLVRTVGPRRAQLAGLGALLVSFALLATASGGATFVMLTAAMVAGAGHGLAHAGAAAAIDVRAPHSERGAVTGALYLAFYLGSGVPAVTVGLLTLRFSLATATSMATAASALLALVAGFLVVATDRPARNPGRIVIHHASPARSAPARVSDKRGRNGRSLNSKNGAHF